MISQLVMDSFQQHGHMIQVIRVQYQCDRCHAYVKETDRICGNCGVCLDC